VAGSGTEIPIPIDVAALPILVIETVSQLRISLRSRLAGKLIARALTGT
jgi:hypothetical protein